MSILVQHTYPEWRSFIKTNLESKVSQCFQYMGPSRGIQEIDELVAISQVMRLHGLIYEFPPNYSDLYVSKETKKFC